MGQGESRVSVTSFILAWRQPMRRRNRWRGDPFVYAQIYKRTSFSFSFTKNNSYFPCKTNKQNLAPLIQCGSINAHSSSLHTHKQKNILFFIYIIMETNTQEKWRPCEWKGKVFVVARVRAGRCARACLSKRRRDRKPDCSIPPFCLQGSPPSPPPFLGGPYRFGGK